MARSVVQWAGEKVARSRRSISPHPRERERASLEGAIRWRMIARCAQKRIRRSSGRMSPLDLDEAESAELLGSDDLKEFDFEH